MVTTKPTEKILDSLKDALKRVNGPVTIADAATKSGLALHETKDGLNYLVGEFRGTLAATSQGELLYSFPTGFSKPWEQRERLTEMWRKTKKFGLGVMKFLVRAWISIVMVGYVVIFALILIGLTFSKNSDRDEGGSSSLMFHTLLRLVLDSLFWTFHPFSPFYVGRDDYQDRYRAREKKVPFYEKVNRFFFGPEEKQMDEKEQVKLALQEIRAKFGRIGLIDLMRVTGMSKEEADPFMAKLMLNHDGDVTVSEDGGIIYEFPAMRKTALTERVSPAQPIWYRREPMPPFTGNDTSANILIAALNGFNLVMSTIAISNGWTVEKLHYMFTVASSGLPPQLVPPPPEGTPLILGWVPFIFSSLLFVIPVVRVLFRNQKRREIDAKNGKRGLIRAILSKLGLSGIKEEALREGWVLQAKATPKGKELTTEIIRLGGELEFDDKDAPIYRFRAIEAEMAALESARKSASRDEAMVGEVIFSSGK